MAKYCKRAVIVEATQWFKDGDHPKVKFAKSLGGQSWMSNKWIINTLEGYMVVDEGDWIITGVKGEHYPCKPDIFALTYDKVEE